MVIVRKMVRTPISNTTQINTILFRHSHLYIAKYENEDSFICLLTSSFAVIGYWKCHNPSKLTDCFAKYSVKNELPGFFPDFWNNWMLD